MIKHLKFTHNFKIVKIQKKNKLKNQSIDHFDIPSCSLLLENLAFCLWMLEGGLIALIVFWLAKLLLTLLREDLLLPRRYSY